MHWAEKFPWERIILGIAVIWGFVGVVSFMLTHAVPSVNREIILSMTAVLGTALGAVVGATFRNNTGDDQKNSTINTLANAAAVPLTTTTTTETTSGDQGTNRTGSCGGEGCDDATRTVAEDNQPLSSPAETDTQAGRTFPSEPPTVDGLGEEIQPGKP